MLESTVLTRAWVARLLNAIAKVPAEWVKVPTVTGVPDCVSVTSPSTKPRLPMAENTSVALAPPWRARVMLAPL